MVVHAVSRCGNDLSAVPPVSLTRLLRSAALISIVRSSRSENGLPRHLDRVASQAETRLSPDRQCVEDCCGSVNILNCFRRRFFDTPATSLLTVHL